MTRFRPGDLLAGRYQLSSHVVRGGQGTVFRARDLSGGDVAVKIAPSRPTTRAEWVALRQLRLPRVAELVDEWPERDVHVLVTRWVDGAPFPGGHGRSWAALKPVVVKLLRVLAVLHAKRIVHLDLKPGNVLVTSPEHGSEPTLLDFGLAQRSGPPAGVGTPLYMAPEQIRTQAVDGRTDLYALGLMLHEALAGAHPHDTGANVWKARLRTPVPPLDRPDVPGHVAATIGRMVARDIDERPATAEDVLRSLGVDPHHEVAAVIGGLHATAAVDLERLFHGPERLLHLPSEGGRLLWERSGGDPQAIADELQTWVGVGFATVDDGRIRITRGRLDTIRRGPPLRPAAPPRTTSPTRDRLLSDAIVAMDAGHHGAALSTLQNLLWLTDDVVPDEAVDRLVEAAIAIGSVEALDLALYEVGRLFSGETPREQLLRAARAVARGMPEEARRALPVRESVPVLQWCIVDVRRAMRLGPPGDDAAVRDAATWAADQASPIARAYGQSWRGHALYRAGAYALAARRHAEAVAIPGLPAYLRLRFRLDQVAALLEVDLGAAHALAAEALHEARGARQPLHEGRAEWLSRHIGYRLGLANTVDDELVDAVLGRRGQTSAVILLNEACIAWRSRADARGRDLAVAARDAFQASSQYLGALLAGSLAVFLGDRPGDAEVLRLAGNAASCPDPSVGVQALALLLRSQTLPPWERTVRDMATRAEAGRRWDERMDILSLAECMPPILRP